MEDRQKYTRLLYGSMENYELKCRGGCDLDMDCVDCPGFESVVQRLGEYEATELSPEEINETLHRFSCFLLEMTGNRMSKTNYTLDAMITQAHDTQEEACDECEYKNGWISVKNRLPKPFQKICVTDGVNVAFGAFLGESNLGILCWRSDIDSTAITHWQPLPDPPTED